MTLNWNGEMRGSGRGHWPTDAAFAQLLDNASAQSNESTRSIDTAENATVKSIMQLFVIIGNEVMFTPKLFLTI